MGKLLSKNLDFYIKTWYNVGMKNLWRAEMVFKRKIYDRFLEWKENWAGKRALLVQGARRIGKSTIVEEFAKNEYETYILINFQSDLGIIGDVEEEEKEKRSLTLIGDGVAYCDTLMYGFDKWIIEKMDFTKGVNEKLK